MSGQKSRADQFQVKLGQVGPCPRCTYELCRFESGTKMIHKVCRRNLLMESNGLEGIINFLDIKLKVKMLSDKF